MSTTTPNIDSLTTAAKKHGKRGLPPIHLWNPPFCGDLDMRIARDGTWYYLGTPIGRKPLVKLFSSILKLDEDGKYYLITPVEKIGITVDDAPFLAVDFTVENPGQDQTITFITQVDDETLASESKPIQVKIDPETNEPSPYVLVRNNLEALIDRKSFYRLVELGTHKEINSISWFGIYSSGIFFPIILSNDLE